MATVTKPTRPQAATAGPQSPLTKTDTPVDYSALIAPSTGLNRVSQGRESAPNPLTGIVKRTEKEGPLKIPVANVDQAKDVTRLLRRDAVANQSGVRIQYHDAKGKSVDVEKAREVHFAAKPRSERKYTADDIRAWSQSTITVETVEDGEKIPDFVRAAFKVAKGFTKVKDK